MVLVVLVTPVTLLLQRATEDELRDRLAAQATSISSTLAEPLLNNQPIDQAGLVDLLIEGDRAEIRARNGDLIAAVGPIINDSIHATVAGAADTRIDVSTTRANVRRRFNGQLSLLGVLAAGGVFVASEESINGAGQDYTTAYSALKVADPASVTAAQVAAGMTTSYWNQYKADGTYDTFSGVLASATTSLQAALKTFVDATVGLTTANRTTMLAAANASVSFDFTEF
jgi:hypothetical protein